MRSLAGDIPEAGMPFHTWWCRVGPLKSREQWNTKLGRLGCGENVSLYNISVIGDKIFQHFNSEGRWEARALQAAPPHDVD